jgi:peptide/nickel transport system permease protein
VQFADVPIMTAYLVMAALIFVVINFTVDVLYATIDPRLRADRVAAGRA